MSPTDAPRTLGESPGDDAEPPPRARPGLGDEGVAPVVAVTLLVGVTVVLGAAAYVVTVELVEQRDAPPPIVMVEDKTSSGHPCASTFWTMQHSRVRWNDLQLAVHGADRYGIRVAGEVALNAPWRGDRLSDELRVSPDDRVRVWVGSGQRATLSVTHLPTGTVVFSRAITTPEPGGPPSVGLALAEGEALRNVTAVEGDATSDCPDLAKVEVTLRRRSDGHYYAAQGMQQAANALEATGRDWSVPVNDSRLTPGDYRVRAVAYDLAGTASVPAVVNVTYQPDCDPGFAWEDADHDGRYDGDVDTRIPDSAILDGFYTVDGSASLVLPASLGDITNATGGIRYEAGAGAHLTVDAPLVAGAGPLHLEAGGRIEVSASLTAELGNDVTLVGGDVSLDTRPDCEADDVSLDNVTVTTDDGDIVVRSDGRVRARDVAFSSLTGRVVVRGDEEVLMNGSKLVSGEADVVVDAGRGGEGRVELVNGTLTADLDNVTVTSRGDVDARDALLQAPAGAIVLDATDPDRTLFVDGAVVDDLDDVAEARPEGVGIVGTPAIGTVDDG